MDTKTTVPLHNPASCKYLQCMNRCSEEEWVSLLHLIKRRCKHSIKSMYFRELKIKVPIVSLISNCQDFERNNRGHFGQLFKLTYFVMWETYILKNFNKHHLALEFFTPKHYNDISLFWLRKQRAWNNF